MANDTDKPDKPIDENENLVKALESIKILLATSETKLSQARESISQASAHSLKMTTEVPMLDDVIVPGRPLEATKPAAKPTTPATTPIKPVTTPKLDLNAFQAELEKEMHSKLSAYAAELEQELKTKIHDYINKHSN